MCCDPEQRAIVVAQQFIAVHQFQPRVEIVLVEKVHCRLGSVAVEIASLTGRAHVVASPDERRRPIAAFEWPVVLQRSRRPANVSVWFESLGTAKKAVANLHGPVPVRHEPKTNRARVPLVRVEVVTILVRFAAIEDRTFELEPAVRKSGRKNSESDVR